MDIDPAEYARLIEGNGHYARVYRRGGESTVLTKFLAKSSVTDIKLGNEDNICLQNRQHPNEYKSSHCDSTIYDVRDCDHEIDGDHKTQVRYDNVATSTANGKLNRCNLREVIEILQNT
ncbi:hypothetical protein GJ496_007175 [Pomphorhynchus laevis]|nr:hypothetical protein GJ496_007175 [Pomphorhynchus laevis]